MPRVQVVMCPHEMEPLLSHARFAICITLAGFLSLSPASTLTPSARLAIPSQEYPSELNVYADFLRIVLEIINSILTYALPKNPEMIYALLHRQELFSPFRAHPRFADLLDNIFAVLEFFNSRMAKERPRGEGSWSVAEVLEVVKANARGWRGDGLKLFAELRFTCGKHPELRPTALALPPLEFVAADGHSLAARPSSSSVTRQPCNPFELPFSSLILTSTHPTPAPLLSCYPTATRPYPGTRRRSTRRSFLSRTAGTSSARTAGSRGTPRRWRSSRRRTRRRRSSQRRVACAQHARARASAWHLCVRACDWMGWDGRG